MPIIEIEDLTFGYEKIPVLEKVNLSIEKGEFIGVIGPNGGGKTTLLKLMMGFLKPQKGKILIFGMEPKLARKKIGYVPQVKSIDKNFPITVFQLVMTGSSKKSSLFGKFSQEAQDKAEELLKKLGLIQFKNKAFGNLSGGLAQRALIARALYKNPEILFLDEPVANIDPKAREEILDIINEWKGVKTILTVTHDLKMIVEKVERIVCVELEVSSFVASEICEHFAMGLYHAPLMSHIEKK